MALNKISTTSQDSVLENNKKVFFLNEDIKACIFDLDGTLLESLGVWEEIDVEFLGKRGFEVPVNYMDMISALSFVETAKFTVDYFKLSDTPMELVEEWNKMAEDKYSTSIKLKEGAKDFLFYLKSCGYRLCVATSLTKRLYEPALKNNGILDIFEFVVSVDEVGFGKERPDVWNYVTHKLNLTPKNCIVFEDLLLAIKSARSIGCYACGVFDIHSDTYRDEIIDNSDYYINNYSQEELQKLTK